MLTISVHLNTVLYVNVTNLAIWTRYVPRLHIHDDLYLGDAVIINRDDKAYMRYFNNKSKALASLFFNRTRRISNGRTTASLALS